MTKYIGILTAGGDTPGLNAAIRGIGKAAMDSYGMNVVGFYDGFRGLMQNRFLRFDSSNLSGILTLGGTILGTSRDKPNKMPVGGQLVDMTDAMLETYTRNQLDVLVCIGGGGTLKNAYKLKQKGMNIITLPKTIDNDIPKTDISFGFDTALGIATDAIDRLHSTAHSHHRIIVVEIMGHNAGWLALGAGIAGGADVILIPELPYDVNHIAEAILHRVRGGKRFSIVAVSEGAMSKEENQRFVNARKELADAKNKSEKEKAEQKIFELTQMHTNSTMNLASRLEALTTLESRVTILGYVQRGGTPSSADRLLATRLGTACAQMIKDGKYGVMLAALGSEVVPVPMEEIVDRRRLVPVDHPWVQSARLVGTNLGE